MIRINREQNLEGASGDALIHVSRTAAAPDTPDRFVQKPSLETD